MLKQFLDPDPGFDRRVSLLLASVVSLVGVSVIASFWPGSIGWDYDAVLKEADTWTFRGHQPPTAGIFAGIFSLGTGNETLIFIIKAAAYFASGLIVIFSRAPLLVRIGAALLICSPIFLYHAPLLRTNTIETSFLGMAIAVGMTGRSRPHIIAAFVSLSIAAMHSQAISPGHLGLIALYFFWHHRDWTLRKIAIHVVATLVALWAIMMVTAAIAGNPSRSSTLYVSAMNGIASLHSQGVETCLTQDLVRESSRTPDEILNDHFEYPSIATVLWRTGEGLRPPLYLSPKQHGAVMDCWKSMAFENPALFAQERIALALQTFPGNAMDPHFVHVREGPWLVFKAPWYEGKPLTVPQRALILYGKVGEAVKLRTIVPYLFAASLLGLLVFFKIRERRFVVLSAGLAIAGFMAPALLISQDTLFRYYLAASYVSGWMVLLFGWIWLTEGSLGKAREADEDV